MSASWIQLEQSVFTHHKTFTVAEELSIDPVQVVGHLAALWTWSIDNAPDGDLVGIRPGVLARAAAWSGQPSEFVAALEVAGYLDVDAAGSRSLHGWAERTGRTLLARDREAARKAAVRARELVARDLAAAEADRAVADRLADEALAVVGRSAGRPADVRRTSGATGPDPAGPGRTSPDLTEPGVDDVAPTAVGGGQQGLPGLLTSMPGGRLSGTADASAGALWALVQADLRGEMTRANYDAWFAGTVARWDRGGAALVVGAGSALVVEQLAKRFRPLVERSVRCVARREWAVSFEVVQEVSGRLPAVVNS